MDIDSIGIDVLCEKHSISLHGFSGGSMHRFMRLLLVACETFMHAFLMQQCNFLMRKCNLA